MSDINVYLLGQEVQAELALIKKTLGSEYRVTLLCRNTVRKNADITLTDDKDPRIQEIVKSMDVTADDPNPTNKEGQE